MAESRRVARGDLWDRAPLLGEALRRNRTWSSAGAEIELSSGISSENAVRLFGIVERQAPGRSLEIGMAHGVSTVAILAAGSGRDDGALVSVDPHESDHWQGAGMELVRRCGWAGRHSLVERPDYLALPEMLARGETYDLVYVDGMHSFEHTFLDFFYSDRLLNVGGILGFNDVGMPAVRKVIRYIQSHTGYVERDVARVSWWRRRRMRFWDWPDRYFEKTSDSRVPWDFYREF